MSNPLSYNVNNNHPLITNSQDYALIRKYVSIHSDDRDFLKYPMPNIEAVIRYLLS